MLSFTSDDRPSHIAGVWYSGEPEKLIQEIDSYIAQAQVPALDGEIIAVVAPHAGYRYSGPTAGYAFSCVQGLKPELVVIVSPLHGYHQDPILTSAHRAYITPLGPVPIDRDAVNELNHHLQKHAGISLFPLTRDGEHSLEIELPFLQRALTSEFRLLPVMIRDKSPRVTKYLGSALAHILRSRTSIIIASTDLSHHYPVSLANQFDTEMLRHITALAPDEVLEAEVNRTGFACGSAAVASTLWASINLGANAAVKLHYSTSGDITGDQKSVVGYGAVAILKRT
jgi:AmmeMemoRadiSam system protein B